MLNARAERLPAPDWRDDRAHPPARLAFLEIALLEDRLPAGAVVFWITADFAGYWVRI